MTTLAGKTALVTGSTGGIGMAIAKAMATEGVNIMLNGLGDPAAIEAERMDMEKTYGVKVMFDGANLLKPDEIESLIGNIADEHGRRRYPGQQCWRPARVANRKLSARPVGHDYRPEPDVELSYDAADPFAAHEGEKVGADRQYRLGTCCGRLAVQSGLCRRQAWPARFSPRQSRWKAAEFGITANAICPGYVHTAAGRQADPGYHGGAQYDARRRSSRTSYWRLNPPKSSSRLKTFPH